MTTATRLQWKPEANLPSGSRYWDSSDGMFRLVASEAIGEITLPREWRLWQWKHGGWCRVAETRSRKRAEKIARQRAAELEDE